MIVTHGRHCPCTPCAREDWTNPNLAHCGMHGPECPAIYLPLPDDRWKGYTTEEWLAKISWWPTPWINRNA